MLSMRFGFSIQSRYPQLKNKSYLYPFVFSVLWGVLMELSQLLVFTYRAAELKDVFANILGASVGLLFSFLSAKLLK